MPNSGILWFTIHSTSPHALVVPGLSTEQITKASGLIQWDVKENHIITHQKKGFVNHFNHHFLASFAMGASAERMQELYKKVHKLIETSSLDYTPTVHIMPGNLEEYRFNDEHYPNWFVFYLNVIKYNGNDWKHILETYFFHHTLFGSMILGLFHPLIQVGYGVKFGCGGLIAQGLEMGSIVKP